ANVDFDVQVAARRPRRAGLAFAAKRQTRACEHAGRDIHFQSALGAYPSASHATRARVRDNRARAAARTARLLNAEKTLIHKHRAVTLTLAASRRLASFLASRTAAIGADLLARDSHRFLTALGGFDEIHLQTQKKI